MSPIIQEFFIAVTLIGATSLVGAIFGYFTFKRLKEHEAVFNLFAAYLMLLLGTFLVLISVIKSKIAPGVHIDSGKGFLIGFAIIWIIMSIYHRLSKHGAAGSHYGTGLILFFMLMMHEMIEGLAVADIFFEMSGGGGLVFASLASLLILTLHEFPEGMMLVMPFFFAGENKKGLFAVFINIAVFAGSAIFAYFVFLRHIELTPHQEALLAGIPAGGIFFLGLHEARNALRQGTSNTSRRLKAVLGAVSVLVTGVIISVLIHTNETIEAKTEVRISGYEKAANGEMIPIIYADPCAHDADLHDCLD